MRLGFELQDCFLAFTLFAQSEFSTSEIGNQGSGIEAHLNFKFSRPDSEGVSLKGERFQYYSK